MYKVLIVEDEKVIADTLAAHLLMGITGVPRLELSLRCLLYFYLQCRTI